MSITLYLTIVLTFGGGALADMMGMKAVCKLEASDAYPGVAGDIMFIKEGNGVKVSGSVTGLTQGQHGFHVHQHGNTSENCVAAGGHFNPTEAAHGLPQDSVRHVGDLGNINAGADGVAAVDITDTVITLSGATSIVGRALVIHADRDKGSDFQPTGESGPRVACCVITDSSVSGGRYLEPTPFFTVVFAVIITVRLLWV